MELFFLDINDSLDSNRIDITQEFLEANRHALRTTKSWSSKKLLGSSRKPKKNQKPISEALAAKGTKIFIAPDHRSTGILLSCYEKSRAKRVHIIVLDAHSDCQGSLEELTNYNVMSWVSYKFSETKKTLIGVRDIDSSSAKIRPFFSQIFTGAFIARYGIEKAIKETIEAINPQEEIWLSIDLDVIDPLLFDAVNAPVSGGLLPREVLTLVESLSGMLAVVEIVEFSSMEASRAEFLFVADLVSASCETYAS